MKKCVWLVPEKQGGIASYSKEIFSELLSQKKDSLQFFYLNSLAKTQRQVGQCVEELIQHKPDLIHIQHEYGLMGSKVPCFYQFPYLVQEIKKKLPASYLLATAHTVIPKNFQYSLKGRRVWKPFRYLANQFFMPYLKRLWGQQTWGKLDAVIAHSTLQLADIQAGEVIEIPHFVPRLKEKHLPQHKDFLRKNLLVFGYFSPEKGQDLVIEALRWLDSSYHLILAGAVRKGSYFSTDESYFKFCLKKIKDLDLENRVEIKGYIPENEMTSLYQKADLAIAPFRETYGSGSLVQALARGASVLASDLDLNLELNQRVDGCLSFFESENPQNCAEKIQKLFSNPSSLENLSKNALEYASTYSLERIAQQHYDLYFKILF